MGETSIMSASKVLSLSKMGGESSAQPSENSLMILLYRFQNSCSAKIYFLVLAHLGYPIFNREALMSKKLNKSGSLLLLLADNVNYRVSILTGTPLKVWQVISDT